MSATVTVYVKVVREITDIIEVDAVTWREAEDRTTHVHGVVRVLESSYDREDLEN